MTIYLELGDYCEIAAELLGTPPEQIARLPRIALADSALAMPQAGFGDQDAYPTLVEKAAVLVEHLVGVSAKMLFQARVVYRGGG